LSRERYSEWKERFVANGSRSDSEGNASVSAEPTDPRQNGDSDSGGKASVSEARESASVVDSPPTSDDDSAAARTYPRQKITQCAKIEIESESESESESAEAVANKTTTSRMQAVVANFKARESDKQEQTNSRVEARKSALRTSAANSKAQKSAVAAQVQVKPAIHLQQWPPPSESSSDRDRSRTPIPRRSPKPPRRLSPTPPWHLGNCASNDSRAHDAELRPMVASSSNSAGVVLKEHSKARSHSGQFFLSSRTAVQEKVDEKGSEPLGYKIGDSRLCFGMQHGLVRREAYAPNLEPQPLPQPRDTWTIGKDLTVTHLPGSVGIGNMQICTWVIGKDCIVDTLAEQLAKSPADFLTIVLSTAVAESHSIYMFLCQLAGVQSEARAVFPDCAPGQFPPEMQSNLLKVRTDKTFMSLGKKVFVAIHRAKVKNTTVTTMSINHRSRGPIDDVGLWCVTLNLILDRQRFDTMKVCIIDVRGQMHGTTVAAVAECVVLGSMDMLTGFFGNGCSAWVSDLASQSHAISWTPLYQSLLCPEQRFHPSFYLMYGYYKEIKVPENVPIADPQWLLSAGDIVHDMMPLTEAPRWNLNDVGNACVQNVGKITMKPLDWKRWFQGCFQTFFWLGTSTPGRGAQARQRAKRKGKGKSSKGKGKGKDKDTHSAAAAASSDVTINEADI